MNNVQTGGQNMQPNEMFWGLYSPLRTACLFSYKKQTESFKVFLKVAYS